MKDIPSTKRRIPRYFTQPSINSLERGVGSRAMAWERFLYASHPDDPDDAGWHVDLSFPGDDCDPNEQQDFSAWRVNVTSRDRALLMLFLFSDVGEEDAPTQIRVGSHIDMARFLEPAGEAGMSHMNLSGMGANRPTALATGSSPRFMAQPPLGLREPYRMFLEDGAYSPVEVSIRQALNYD